MFIIGANYRLELRDKDKKKLVISLKSYFGIKSTQKFDLIQKVADSIWDEFLGINSVKLSTIGVMERL